MRSFESSLLGISVESVNLTVSSNNKFRYDGYRKNVN